MDHVSEAGDALGIFRVSSCMGHIKSHYMAGIMNMIGLGVRQDNTQVCKQTGSAMDAFMVVQFPDIYHDIQVCSTVDMIILFAGLEIFVAWSC